MRHFISVLLIIFCFSALLIQDVQAKRFGGGRSFGMQRSTNYYSRVQPHQPLGQRLTSNRWFGPLAGLVAGGLLASLFMGNGIGTGILSWLLIAGIVLAVVNLFRNRLRMSTSMQYGQKGNLAANQSNYFQPNNDWIRTHEVIPPGFDSDTFLREAKVQFIRLQAAYDQKDLNDLRQFTTPQVFAEIQMQLQERGDAFNQTEVVNLDVKLLEASNDEPRMLNNNSNTNPTLASVQFSGLIKENNAEATSFKEIWHFQNINQNWIVAGIQQM